MMRLTIKLDMDNAAFHEHDEELHGEADMMEVRDCINETLDRLSSLDWSNMHWQNIHDTNGNPTGQFRVSGA